MLRTNYLKLLTDIYIIILFSNLVAFGTNYVFLLDFWIFEVFLGEKNNLFFMFGVFRKFF